MQYTPASQQRLELSIVQRARKLLEAHPYFRGRSALFEFEVSGNVLAVRGRLPTFHLKQSVQISLAKVDGVKRIDNRIVVDAVAGLGSVGK
jgi:hypothetical protein